MPFYRRLVRSGLLAGLTWAAATRGYAQYNNPQQQQPGGEPTRAPLPQLAPAPPSAPVHSPDAVAKPGEEKIEAVLVKSNRYIQTETLLYYIATKAGDRFDEERLQEDFRRLWDTGFLEDLILHVDDGQTGKIVTFQVIERARIQFVDYKGSKALSASTIEDELKKKEAALRVDNFFDLGRVRRVEAIIKQMLEEKGRPFAKVKHEAKPVGSGGVQVTFNIDDGTRIKVGQIDITGNSVFEDAQIKRSMKSVKESGFFNLSWLSGKTTWTDDKWHDPQEGDRRRVEDFFLNNGYVTATVGEPKITYHDGKSFWLRKPMKWMRIEIPVTEGDRYRVGKVDFEGLTVFKPEGVRTLFKLEPGNIYREGRIKKGYEKLRELYGSQGYFQWHGFTKRQPDPAKKVVDVTLAMEEDKRYFVGRITFTGNDVTRDKVIRREVYLNEGDVFNTEALKLSIRRVNQLGYFKPMEGPPEISPSPQGEEKMDVTFKVEEQNRNQFTFGAGVSGVEGTFVNASFQTSNFLGAGETFQISAQSGARTKNYQLAVTEPYLFDRPITAGIDIYKRRIEYQALNLGESVFRGYIDDRTGMSLTGGLPLGRFTRLYANYAYEIVKIENRTLTDEEVQDPTRPFAGVLDPLLLEEEGKRHESRLSPSLVHNTVDNPYAPRSGKKISLTFAGAGGPLGGSMDYVKPTAEVVWYMPHTRKTALGLRAEAAMITPFGDTSALDPETKRDKLPFWQRYSLMLGGETTIRGFDPRVIGPRDEALRPNANKYLLFNAEYYFDLSPMMRTLVFFDAGKSYKKGESFDTKGYYTSTGVEVRFIMPVLNVPFRLIYSFNPGRGALPDQKGGFKFAVGTTF
jgi:outer membrane protein insertion porin family